MFSLQRRVYLYLAVFVVGVLVRIVPEFYSGSYPVGCDVPFYVFELRQMESGFSLDMLFFGNPLTYGLLLTLHGVCGVDWFLLFKIFLPLLNGFVGVSFLYFLRNGLNLKWSCWEYFLCCLLLLFSSSGIIMGNGIVKNQVAMCFFFVFLVMYKHKNLRFELLFCLLLLLTHQIISLLLLLFLVGDFIVAKLRDEESHRGLIYIVVLLVLGEVFVIFVLPTLGCVDWVGLVVKHFGAYFGSAGYGVRYTNGDVWGRMWGHFVWYYGLWFGFVVFAFSRWFRNRWVNLLCLICLVLGWLPLGNIWARFQWFLVYPLAVIFVGGTKGNYWVFKVWRVLLILVVVVNGVFVVTDMNWSMTRSSLPFKNIDDVKFSYDVISGELSDNCLIIDADVCLAYTNLYCLDGGYNPFVVSERLCSFSVVDGGVLLSLRGVKGHNFYVFRDNSVDVSLDSFDSVFVVNSEWFTGKDTFGGVWGFFEKFYIDNNTIIYRYGDR